LHMLHQIFRFNDATAGICHTIQAKANHPKNKQLVNQQQQLIQYRYQQQYGKR